MSSTEDEGEDVGALGQELAKIAKRRVALAFVDQAVAVDRYPIYTRIVAASEPVLWREDPTRAATLVLRRAVDSLPNQEDGPFGQNSTRTWRQAANILYFGSDAHPGTTSYADLRAQLKSTARLSSSDRTLTREIGVLRKMLGILLLDFETAARRDSHHSHRPRSLGLLLGNAYVARPLYEERVGRALERSQVVEIVGESGLGKTLLAWKVARDHSPADRILFVDIARPDRIKSAITDHAAKLGNYAYSGRDNSDSLLRRIISGQKIDGIPPIDIVILDNAKKLNETAAILPISISIPVLITSSRRLMPDDWGNAVMLGPFSTDQAESLVNQLIPEITTEELEYFQVLGGWPLIITQVCKVAAGLSAAKRRVFLRKLNRDVPAVVGLVAGQVGQRGLHKAYQEILAELSGDAENSHALWILACLTANRATVINNQLVVAYISILLVDLGKDPELADLFFDSGIEILARYGVVYKTYEEVFCHRLTIDILGDMFGDTLFDVQLRMLRIAETMIDSQLRQAQFFLTSSSDPSPPIAHLSYMHRSATIWSELKEEIRQCRTHPDPDRIKAALEIAWYALS